MKFCHSFSRYVTVKRFLPKHNKFVSLPLSIPASCPLPTTHFPPSSCCLPPAIPSLSFRALVLLLFVPNRVARRGGPAARLTVLGASYTFTPVCAFFRERTCPFHVPLERARYIYPPLEYVYTNGQQTDVADPIVSGASRYLEGSRAELKGSFTNSRQQFSRSFTVRSYDHLLRRTIDSSGKTVIWHN